MIVAITSKGGGPGCTTVAFFLSQILGRDKNMSIAYEAGQKSVQRNIDMMDKLFKDHKDLYIG